MTKIIERQHQRRINGLSIPCFERRDGTQRTEWLGLDAEHEGPDASYGSIGRIYKYKWEGRVLATRRSDGEQRCFAVYKYGRTVEQAFAEARVWLVGSAQEQEA